MTKQDRQLITDLHTKIDLIINTLHLGQKPMKTVESINQQAQKDFEKMVRRGEK